MLFQFPGPSSLTQFLNSYLKTLAVFQNSDYLGCSFLPKCCFCKSKCWNVLFPCPPGHFWTRSAHLWTPKPTAVWPKWSLSFTCWRLSNTVSFSKLKACCCFFLIIIFWGSVKTQNCLLHRLSPCSGPLWSSPEGSSHIPPAASKRPRSHVRRRHRRPEASGWNSAIFDGSLNLKMGEKAEWLFLEWLLFCLPQGYVRIIRENLEWDSEFATSTAWGLLVSQASAKSVISSRLRRLSRVFCILFCTTCILMCLSNLCCYNKTNGIQPNCVVEFFHDVLRL